MDVRCDRCATEYELEDDSVGDLGASVQCTTCGHTFMVMRPAAGVSAPRAVPRDGAFNTSEASDTTVAGAPRSPTARLTPVVSQTSATEPEAAVWTLTTDDGKVHRFRDLTVLQKWIVERRVSRGDRVVRGGEDWRALGEIAELRPFFDVVDQADRARPVIGGVSVTRLPSGGRGVAGVSVPAIYDAPTVPDMRLQAGGAAAARAPATRAALTDADKTPIAGSPRPQVRTEIVYDPSVSDDPGELDDILPNRSRRARIALLAVAALIGVAGALYGWLGHSRAPAGGDAAVAGAATPAAAPAPAPVVSGQPPPATPQLAKDVANGDVKGGGENAAGAPNAGPRPLAAAPSDSAPSRNVDTPPPTAPPAAAGSAPAGSPAEPTSPSLPPASSRVERRSAPAAMGSDRLDRKLDAPTPEVSRGGYDRLVADGDRLLENGQTSKAEKLFAEALALRPDGVAAITGTGYVLLDRQKHFKAIDTFRRALEIEPNYGPALFGVAEAYRARGDTTQAVNAYRQYLATSPRGPDAPAARRQIQELESLPSPTTTAPSNLPPLPDTPPSAPPASN